MDVEELLTSITAQRPLLTERTPLHFLPRLSQEVGREIWIKRDDLTTIGFGGNKIRKIEFLLAEADAMQADTLVTVGAAQSNHCRAVAAVAAMTGRRCVLILGGADPGTQTGNLLLDRMWGAETVFVDTEDWAERFAAAQEHCERLSADGATPYLIPVGGSTPLGASGYVRAYAEMIDQGLAGTVVCATASGGTHAGLLAGQVLLGGPAVVGVAVAQPAEFMRQLGMGIANETLRIHGQDASVTEAAVLDGYLGEGYGIPTEAAQAAIETLMRTEGIVLDPVYTGKAFAAVLAADPGIPEGPVTFLHTGGSTALFA